MNKPFIISLVIATLCSGIPYAKEFYQFPKTDTLQGRDILLIRRPAAIGYDNNTGTRNVPGTTLFRIITGAAASKARLAAVQGKSSSALQGHRAETLQAHGGIGQMLASHEQLTTTAHGGLVAATDPRLSDARTPLAHNQAASTITGLATVATSGRYSDLSGLPLLFSGNYSDLIGKPALSTVATSGSYADLSNKPTIPAAQVNSDWAAGSGLAQILNKPAIPMACVDIFDGAPGEQGPQGPPGNTGASGTIAVGTVTTGAPGTNVVVTDTGTPSAAIFNFTIPRGADGDISNITQAQILAKIAELSTGILERRSNGTDDDVLIQVKDVSIGNVRFFVTGKGQLVIKDSNGYFRFAFDPATNTIRLKDVSNKTRLEIDTLGQLKQYAADGTTKIFETYTSGRQKAYNRTSGKLTWMVDPLGQRTEYRPDGVTPRFQTFTAGRTVL
jgi:hypothetical protein